MPERTRTIMIPGGSGFLGRSVARYMQAKGWRVIVLSRKTGSGTNGVHTVQWDGETIGPWAELLNQTDVVLNLAGRNVNCRYTAKNRIEIERSRVASTTVLGRAIAAAKTPPKLWLNSSTATIYRHAEDRPQDEQTGEIGSGFSVGIALAWEKAFFDAPTPPDVRKIALRSAMVMGPGHGGPFGVFQTLVRLRLGGRMGSGRQYVSWIHIEDFCRAIEFLIEREDLEGPVNLAAPQAVPNQQFMQTLREACHISIGLPATRWMLEIGAFFLRTETELPLKSRWVYPQRLLIEGFAFNYPDWRMAAMELCRI